MGRMWVAVSGLVILVASGCGGGAEIQAPFAYDAEKAVHGKFSGKRALEHVAKVVGFGARPPGSDALEETRKYIEAELSKSGWEVKRQVFEDETPQGKIEFVNMRARFVGEDKGESAGWDSAVGVLLGGHYDTKFYEEMEFVGANDAGSSTGGLIEAGAALAHHPALAKKVELVFFDGEEAYVAYSPTDGLYGSRYYAKELRKTGARSFPGAVVILDLIGDRDLTIGIPANCSEKLFQKTARAAVELGHGAHFFPSENPVTDDHEPFNALRIPTVNLIDLDYSPWHTSRDTMDKISARSMEKVGQVALLMIEKFLLPDPVSP